MSEVAIDPTDREAILAAASDYIEGWLDGDAERMARCLHPDLAKRSVDPAPGDEARLDNLTRDQMVAATAEGRGRRHPRSFDVSILDAYGDIASVRVFSSAYMDYLHVARCGERWLLVNVLWRPRLDP